MSDHRPHRNETDSVDECAGGPVGRTRSRVGDAIADTGTYETDGGVVLYDFDNPLAWIEADSALDVEKAV